MSVRHGIFRFAAAELAILGFCWCIFLGRLTVDESVVGAVAMLISAFLSAAAYASNLAHFWPRPAWLFELRRVPWFITRDLWTIVVAVVAYHVLRRPNRCRIIALPFRAGGRSAPAQTRRALATMFTTLTPNSIVLDIDAEHDLIIIHEISPTSVRLLAEDLESA